MVVLRTRGDKGVMGLAGLSISLYVLTAQLVTGPQHTIWWLLAYAAQWGFYLALFARRSHEDFVASPAVLLTWALASRLALVATSPWLSDDLYRYLLDGQVFAGGLNPYMFPPANPAVAVLAPDLVGLVNHPEVPTIYPPLAQIVGLAAAWLDLGVVGWRVLAVFADVAAMVAVVALFRGRDRGWKAGAVYGLCPLAIWESGANGHLEAWAALALISGAWAWQSRRAWWAGFGFGCAALFKLYPLMLLPAFLRERDASKAILAALLTVCAGFAPFVYSGADVGAGLREYLQYWQFNSPIHDVLSRWGQDTLLWRLVPFVFIGLGGTWAAWRGVDPKRSVPMLLFGFLLLGPTLHPWYALWVLPWLGDRPHLGLWSFVAAMGGAYAVWWEVARRGVWELPAGVGVLIWGLVALGWLAALWREGGSTPQPAA